MSYWGVEVVLANLLLSILEVQFLVFYIVQDLFSAIMII